MKTAQEYRETATADHQKAQESFERCDTDGFVSQHCHGLNGRLNAAKADLRERGCVDIFTGLYDGNRRVAAKMFTKTFYGHPSVSWVLNDEEAERYGRRFIPAGPRSRVQKQLGLREADEEAPAWAVLNGSGTGFSGLASVGVKIFRTGDPWGTDAKLLEPVEE